MQAADGDAEELGGLLRGQVVCDGVAVVVQEIWDVGSCQVLHAQTQRGSLTNTTPGRRSQSPARPPGALSLARSEGIYYRAAVAAVEDLLSTDFMNHFSPAIVSTAAFDA